MFRWLRERRASGQARDALVRADAASLIERFGDFAYSEARTRVQHEQEGIVLDGNRPRGHWARVKLRIADETGHEIGLDTATRYLMR